MEKKSGKDANDSAPTKEEQFQSFRLEPEQELRFEVEGNQKVELEVRSGLAELFGTELMKGRHYTFIGGAKVGVFTWHGCSLDITGSLEVSYISKETPMTFYVNIQAKLEERRVKAAEDGTLGPKVLIAGPGDVGKSTLSRLLLNYANRRGGSPLFVDLDVGQGSVGIPGTLGMMVVERPADVEEGFSQVAPCLLHFGSTSPGENISLYNKLITRLADIVSQKFTFDPKVKHSGVIINSCGWVTGNGYKSLKWAAKEFEVDIVLVLDQERLYNELARDLPGFVKVIFVPKSGGVVVRPPEVRRESRLSRIREYFYGSLLKLTTGNSQFYPHSFDVPFGQFKLYKIGAPALPDSCLPIGMKPDDNQTKLVPITPNQSILHHLFSVSSSTTSSEAIESNIQGVVCITQVDMERQVVTVLSPQARPLPANCLLLFSEIQFMDSH